LKVGDITLLDFENGVFDAVIDNEAICCNSFNDSVKIYAELARVCKPGGKLFSRAFAKGCWGDGTGQPVGHNAWIVAEGPLLNKGFNRFTELSEIPELIKGFEIKETELLTRTMEGRKHEVKEWLIVGEKQQ
jgi:SAM-dependent methyltransferase